MIKPDYVANRSAKIFLAIPLIGFILVGIGIFSFDEIVEEKDPFDHLSEPTIRLEDVPDVGDLVPLEQVKDYAGYYTRMTINPQSDALQLNPEIILPSAYDIGFNDLDISSAQRYIVKFVAEETYDSIALDSLYGYNYPEWLIETGADNALHDTHDFFKYEFDDNVSSALVNNNLKDTHPIFVRDGGSRMDDASITVDSIEGKSDSVVGNYLEFKISGQATYRVSDSEVNIFTAIKYINLISKDLEGYKEFGEGLAERQENILNSWDTENPWVVDYDLSYAVVNHQGEYKIYMYDNAITNQLPEWALLRINGTTY